VHRLVTGIPERLSLPVLAALCDILECTPAELIATRAANAAPRKTGTGDAVAAAGLPDDLRPRRARRRPPGPAAPTAPRGVSCARCGSQGRLPAGRRCARCALTDKLAAGVLGVEDPPLRLPMRRPQLGGRQDRYHPVSGGGGLLHLVGPVVAE
jgi:Cro/C1-type HTH DNA-binding domain